MQIQFFHGGRPGLRRAAIVLRLIGVLAACWILGCGPKVVLPPPEPSPAPPEARRVFEEAEQRYLAGDFETALAAYGEYLRRAPSGSLADAALMKSGASLEALRRYEEARSRYRALLRHHPDSPFAGEARVALLATYLSEGRLEELIAEGAAMDAESLSPPVRARLYRILADAYWLKGSPEEAARNYALSHSGLSGEAAEEVLQRLQEALALLSPEALEGLLGTVEDDGVRRLLQETAKPLVFSRLRFGCVLPLSGKFESFGRRALQGIELAVSEYGKRHFSPGLAVTVRDSGSDPEQAAVAIRQLAEEHQVSAVIGSLATAETVARECQRLGIPVVAFTQKEGIPQIGDYVFRNFFTPQMQVEALVSFAAGSLGVSGYAILYPDENYGRLFMNLFWDAVASRGGEILGVQAYEPGQTDFSDRIQKLLDLFYPEAAVAETGPEAGMTGMRPETASPGETLAGRRPPDADFHGLFIPDSPKTAGLIIPQLAFHDVQNTYLLGTNLWHSESFIEMTREHSRSAVIPTGFFARSESEIVRRFTASFTETFGREPEFIEAVAYDTAMMLFRTAKAPGVQSRADLRDALLRLSPHPGVTGPTGFAEDGECSKPLRLLRVQGDRFVEIPFQP